MDLSVQKMQPPASVQGKSAAKRTSRSGAVTEEDAVESAERDQKVRFTHGNTGYETIDPDQQDNQEKDARKQKRQLGQQQLLSGEDLSELNSSMETAQIAEKSADGLMKIRAYQSAPAPAVSDDEPHFDRNI
ncbi:hypothetical protein [Cohaesibacter gelatinilyticus]|uniref:Uncharacterized protein n=1 Tax=Cohaesibacter gelatinilyticus TaxID=372072 RepID=A0A285NLX2_9HYPH|nr:hypothetical protein [Cohaesibacter gelatinilyticus]SNZ08856.1 hypothetical protein SAMN06265368_1848 [Cohaesibacter gelatinilyticus]HAT86556.1 hypothetical protein [Hyphomicrobiales bacterium]